MRVIILLLITALLFSPNPTGATECNFIPGSPSLVEATQCYKSGKQYCRAVVSCGAKKQLSFAQTASPFSCTNDVAVYLNNQPGIESNPATLVGGLDLKSIDLVKKNLSAQASESLVRDAFEKYSELRNFQPFYKDSSQTFKKASRPLADELCDGLWGNMGKDTDRLARSHCMKKVISVYDEIGDILIDERA